MAWGGREQGDIPFFNEMIQYWKKRAKEDGFEGIFLICMKDAKSHVYASQNVDGTVDFEPNNTKAAKLLEKTTGITPVDKGSIVRNRLAMKSIDYGALNREMLLTVHKKNEYRTLFVDYDDTPRRGRRGVITFGSTPKRFMYYLKKSLMQAEKEKNEFLFINAWNEWGEGNYLEPDTMHGYAYLGAIKKARGL